MNAIQFDLFIQEINWTQDRRNLSALRKEFRSLLDAGKIPADLYHGLNKEIRSREDWLRGRKK